jgi:hypothetical protein
MLPAYYANAATPNLRERGYSRERSGRYTIAFADFRFVLRLPAFYANAATSYGKCARHEIDCEINMSDGHMRRPVRAVK